MCNKIYIKSIYLNDVLNCSILKLRWGIVSIVYKFRFSFFLFFSNIWKRNIKRQLLLVGVYCLLAYLNIVVL